MTWSRPLAITGSWLGIALVAAAEVSVRAYAIGYARVGHAIAAELSIIPLWALITPAVFTATARWRLTWRSAPLYFVAGLVFTVVANAIIRIPLLFSHGFVQSLIVGLTIFTPGAMLAWSAIVAIGVWLAPRPEKPGTPTHLVLPDGAKVLRVALEAIEWVEAEDNYVRIHTPDKTHTIRQRMRDLESQLDTARFARVHRSAIVSLARVAAVRPLTHGDFEVVLESGAVVRGTRSRREAFAGLSPSLSSRA
jgi:hypothetical protein